ncbi:hypothetical protein Pyn_30372 [Prunus yedoensis var. nudiflora]|uniref:Uncharacterized protein n=1 Tax=Prunus yedoensis var. nudiflora TaxID=2094558 RepID=A0A314XJZ7_PRUYE|nr:hypothetical protein Pyn_30372 [Prunus yedoensis var. nudiflora]
MKNLSQVLCLNVTEDNIALVCVEIPPRVHSAGIWTVVLCPVETEVLHFQSSKGKWVWLSPPPKSFITFSGRFDPWSGVLGSIPSYARFTFSIVSQNAFGTHNVWVLKELVPVQPQPLVQLPSVNLQCSPSQHFPNPPLTNELRKLN